MDRKIVNKVGGGLREAAGGVTVADHPVSTNECATVIGNDVVIKGEITVEKGLRVDGQIEGAVTTKGRVHVGKSGQLSAEINGGAVFVEGKVKGNITASERLTLEATSNVSGDLTATKLVVIEGATVVGKVNIGPEVVVKGQAPAREREIAPAPAVAGRVGSQSVFAGAGRH
jgi:cytoskeletal protein CcmA (bactofilin family)